MAKPKYLAERAAIAAARSEVEKCQEACKAADAARDAAYAVARAADALCAAADCDLRDQQKRCPVPDRQR